MLFWEGALGPSKRPLKDKKSLFSEETNAIRTAVTARLVHLQNMTSIQAVNILISTVGNSH